MPQFPVGLKTPHKIGALGAKTEKPLCPIPQTRQLQLRKSWKQGNWIYTSCMYGHSIRCLPRKVLVRILELTLVSILGVSVTTMATDSPQ